MLAGYRRASSLLTRNFSKINYDRINLPSEWEAKAGKELKTENVKERLVRNTHEDIPYKPVYTSDDVPVREAEDLPGFFPYTRGPYATMYTGRPWTVR